MVKEVNKVEKDNEKVQATATKLVGPLENVVD